jgi:hypothetical protein
VSGAVYASAEEYLTEIRDALREVVDRVIELGCDYIQLDAPNYGSLCDPDNRARLAAAGVDVDAQIAFDAALRSPGPPGGKRGQVLFPCAAGPARAGPAAHGQETRLGKGEPMAQLAMGAGTAHGPRWAS